MKTTALVLGVLFALLGLLWIGQGVGLIKGSFMTGSGFWGGVGAVVLVAGGGLVWFGLRKRSPA